MHSDVRHEPRVRLIDFMVALTNMIAFRYACQAHQIVGMGEAFHLTHQRSCRRAARLSALREQLWQTLQTAVPEAVLNGHPTQRVCGILNVGFPGIEGESLLFACSELAVSSGSACTSADRQPSFVLRALGRDDRLAGTVFASVSGGLPRLRKWKRQCAS